MMELTDINRVEPNAVEDQEVLDLAHFKQTDSLVIINKALEMLYPTILSYCKSLFYGAWNPEEDAVDMANESVLLLYQDMPSFSGGNLTKWALTVVKHAFLRKMKAAHTHPVVEYSDAHFYDQDLWGLKPNQSRPLYENESWVRGLVPMTHRMLQVCELYDAGKTRSEIAEVLGIKEITVKRYINNIKRIRKARITVSQQDFRETGSANRGEVENATTDKGC